jgi:hypothetical protein
VRRAVHIYSALSNQDYQDSVLIALCLLSSRPGPLGGSGEFRLGPAGETTAHSINPTTGAVAGFQDTGHVIRNTRKFPGVLLSTGESLWWSILGADVCWTDRFRRPS